MREILINPKKQKTFSIEVREEGKLGMEPSEVVWEHEIKNEFCELVGKTISTTKIEIGTPKIMNFTFKCKSKDPQQDKNTPPIKDQIVFRSYLLGKPDTMIEKRVYTVKIDPSAGS